MMTTITEDTDYEKNVHLDQITANMRYESVSDLSYKVDLCMPKGDWFSGFIQIEFNCKKMPTADLYLDFRGCKVANLKINKSDVVADFRGHHVHLPAQYLKLGDNHISMFILNKYRNDGCGLHSFIDQQDSLQYLYTQFEVDYCHYVFPCFDQPDLKAVWQFSALTEDDWCVISNEHEVQDDEEREAQLLQGSEMAKIIFKEQEGLGKIQSPRISIFRESDRFSTYLMAIVAGPFDYHERNTPGLPPMRVYSRKTVFADLSHSSEEMFNVTQAGMNFYKEFFGKAYPFRKYDQIFVPEHSAGAMENTGCVTYNEIYLMRGETRTLAKRLRFSITNLHELAHMWFGNLVTMKWWNDLWLNESFATFMSFLAMEQSPTIDYFHPTCWVTFNQYAFWGVSTDQLSSTHPICAEVASTGEAESMFDGISYGKGSAFLKQFYNLLGYETMKKGLHAYFEKHQWGNTVLPDFVTCMQDAWNESGDKSLGADFNLQRWCDEWLTTSGINIIEPIIGEGLSVKQSMGLRGKNRLRKQRLDIALYSQDGQVHVIKNHVLSEKEEMTVVDLSSVPAGFKFVAVYLNHGSHAYTKVRFDQSSIDWFVQNTSAVESAVTRAAVWRYFWMLVMDKKMSSVKYIEFVGKNLPTESVEQIISTGLLNLSSLISNYIPQDTVKDNQKVLFNTLIQLLKQDTGMPKDPIVDALFGFISNDEHLKMALDWMNDSEIKVDGASLFKLNKKHNYSILSRLFRSRSYTYDQKMEHMTKVMADDNTDIAVNTRAKCMAALPDAAMKAKIWAEIVDCNSKDSVYLRTAKIQGFYSWDQLDIISPYFDKFYEELPRLSELSSHRYFQTFFYSLLPTMQIADAHIVKLVSMKANTADSDKNFSNQLQDGIEVLVRCMEVRQFAKL